MTRFALGHIAYDLSPTELRAQRVDELLAIATSGRGEFWTASPTVPQWDHEQQFAVFDLVAAILRTPARDDKWIVFMGALRQLLMEYAEMRADE